MIVLLFLQVLSIVTAKNVPYYNSVDALTLFKDFVNTYDKVYDSYEELEMRYNIFMKNLDEINNLNKISEHAEFGINEFTDLTDEEFQTLYTGYKPSKQSKKCKTVSKESEEFKSAETPKEFDWRTKGVVSKVRAQGHCGSCWAFGVVGNVESAYAIKSKKLLELSEQQLLDCDHSQLGCHGGDPIMAFWYIMDHGIMTEKDYPYKAVKNEDCKYDPAKVSVNVTGCLSIEIEKEDQLPEFLYKIGPITIGVAATHLKKYHHGIFSSCKDDVINHSVLLVGYGVDNGVPYWLVKNSWGVKWGEDGYFRMKRGVNCLTFLYDLKLAAVM